MSSTRAGHPVFDFGIALVIVPGVVSATAAVHLSRLPRFD
jgi:hypothetical protein